MTKTRKANSKQKTANRKDISFCFFGTSQIAVGILNELERAGFLPALVVAAPDTPKGRGMKLTEPPVKVWANERGIETLQPQELDSEFCYKLQATSYRLFVVVDYGKLLPRTVLDTPKRGALNVHFSLLPRYRGASPIRSAILSDDRNIGTSIILLSEKLDEGPIVAQKKFDISNWPPKASELDKLLTRESGRLLSQVLPEWIEGNIEAREQNHDLATYCEKIKKEDGLLDLSGDAYKNLLKIRAYEGWPGTYTFFERSGKKIRVGILDAHLGGDKLVIDKVKPEGKREMSYDEFLRSGAKPV
ncbi:hypothetical protein A3A39_00215 [Candidatus Kaiserbacteria bacterium RIFCSPLOWO2_01_FULL_54_13]|uniref:methionyl-tRNA formyltransferase n=1 Tax=Candidatus Kaiserbacteria bacterium RIFCSPLOWO2_01_FULL_54_13 TaxID=1798512 RepID=A0A1F6F3Q8_9BACT|nr:MAG: hypothetical protein A3A39_00215 [Candidatus Kaiserbacteria bacterium RIFCSPLOWO2_01_FULL_54_13]